MDESVAEISCRGQKYELSTDYIEIAKNISRIFSGKNVNFNIESLDLEFPKS